VIGTAFEAGKIGFMTKAFVHGLTQGIFSEAMGGDFRSGFVGGFVGSITGPIVPEGVVTGTLVSAMIGGTISELTGGKFRNGAKSAAIVHLFNDLMHQENNSGGGEPSSNEPELPQDEEAISRGIDILVEAESWNGTPYAPSPQDHPDNPLNVYAGGNAVKGVGADCSGSVHGIYENAGISYEYRNTVGFAQDYEKLGFSNVTVPLPGDIVLFKGHMGIYRGNNTYNLYSARSIGKVFSPTKSSWYEGTPRYFRHNSLMGNK
jgi:hypothetical protein